MITITIKGSHGRYTYHEFKASFTIARAIERILFACCELIDTNIPGDKEKMIEVSIYTDTDSVKEDL